MSKRLAKLFKPPCDLTKYDNEEYMKNPLLKFRLSDVKERRHYALLRKKAAEEKIKLCRMKLEDEGDVIQYPESYYLEKLRECASNTPIPKMLQKTENKIRAFVSKRLKDKYSWIVKEYMQALNSEHDRIIKAYSLSKILRHPKAPDDHSEDVKKTDFQFKLLGRTPNYNTFLQNRERIRNFLYLNQPYVRAILHYSITKFPNILNDYGVYNPSDKDKGPLTLHSFLKIATKDLVNNSQFIKRVWYPEIVGIIKKHYKKSMLKTNQWKRAFRCVKGLINRQINMLKIRTIEHLMEVLTDRKRMPHFKLELICEKNRIELNPSFDVIVAGFCDIVKDISEVANNMDPLEAQIDRLKFPSADEHLYINLNGAYLETMITALVKNLNILYAPIFKHVEKFQTKYLELCTEDTQKNLEEFLNDSYDFSVYFSKIESYNKYNNSLRGEVQKEFFDIAIVGSSMAVKSLRATTDSLIVRITEKIVKRHIEEIEEICKTFEGIRDKAYEVPRSTEELLTSGEYMLEVKTKTVQELQERIQESLKINSDLVELTELSPQHTKMQIAAINWLNDVKEVFEQNANFHEAYKLHFEEHLQECYKKLNEDIAEMLPNMSVINDMSDTEKFRDYYILLQNFIDQIGVFDDYVAWINKEEKLFKFPKTTYSVLDAIKDFVIPFAALMKLCIRWLRHYYVWMDGPFEYLEPQFVEETTDAFYQNFIKNQKYYRNRIKQDLIGNPVCKFRGQTEDPDPEKHPVPLRLCSKMIQWIKDFRIGVFIVRIMCNPALRERHWAEMSELAGFDITPDAGTSLRKIINFKLDDKLDGFEVISVGANKELQLQENLHAMTSEWNQIAFPTGSYRETGITILSNLDDIQALLDDHILKTLTMRGSAFVRPCEAEVRNWYDQLVRINRTIEEWTKVQSNLLYLLPIFSSKDIVAQMPEEGRLFSQVERIYTQHITRIQKDPNVLHVAPSIGFLEDLEEANELLERINNGVNIYLEKKRLFFPRFFFLSNDEMLEILSETKNPIRVEPHLPKCFEGIHRLEFSENLDVISMLSSNNEKLKFVAKVSTSAAGGSVEKWLAQVEDEMLEAVSNQIALSYVEYREKKRSIWALNWPQMVVLCVSQIYWTAEVHSSIQTKNQTLIRNLYEDLSKNLNGIVAVIRSKDITNLNRITIKSLIVIDVHARDVVADLIAKAVCSETDFQWLSQLRYYLHNREVLVKIINASVKFGNEYLGNSDRLVITPLTDRCYRTLIAAYQLHLNGAPEGPAGTGKTETTKDLAKALAVQCKVFNCSEGLDYKAMGKFFKGLASCGAWACFDEFNRIDLEVLSVIAQQILSIIQAVRSDVKNFVFEGTTIVLNPACYVCITMNPGYAGRSELPDNLKVLFRSVAMMVPDYAMIAEISLYSYGFMNARTLSVKIVTTYRLCSELLSSQNHYDYGMRAVKTVLSACGNIKKNFPDENEEILLLRSLLDVNLPKFLACDIPLFEGIISDLFPGIKPTSTDNSSIAEAFKDICTEMNLQPHDTFLTKVIQTFEMMIVRHGFMVVGLPMAGKSSTLKVLAKVLARLKHTVTSPYFQDVQYSVINPKSISMSQLYGAFDPVTYEWTDGIASSIFRNFAKDTSDDRKWLIFDGPVDAVWIENLNTVLDDNKKLCLNSGEVIIMSTQMTMIFEVMDLSQASPATVSRCGMIFMEPVSLGWETFAISWLNQCDPKWVLEGRNVILELFKWLIPPSLHFVKNQGSQLLNAGEYSLVRTTFDLYEMCLHDALEENPEEYQKFLSSWYQAAMIFSVTWGIGGILNTESREKFDIFHRNLWNGTNSKHPVPSSIGRIDISIPIEGLLCEYCYIFKQKGSWKYWPDLVRRAESEETSLGLQVPTLDTGRYLHLLEMHIKHNKKLLFVGPNGTGKSFYTQNYIMNKLPDEKYVPAFVTFTVMITANQVQELFLSKLLKHKRSVFGPPKAKTCVIFVDDMNMPVKEAYGAQPPIELLRQFFDLGHWYDLKDASKIFLRDLLIICACDIPGGSRQEVYARFLSHFNIFSMNAFSDETINRIFTTTLLNGFKKCGHPADVINSVNQIVSSSQQIYGEVCKELRPTPSKAHYIFNVRDIGRLCTGCALLKKESVDNKKIFARIWYHEAMRVFYDRLVDDNDQFWLFTRMNQCVTEHFMEPMEVLFENYCEVDGEIKLLGVRKLMFGTYMDEDASPDDKKYEEVPSIDVFNRLAVKALEEYNSMRRTKMDIVLFSYALEHLNKICRIISIQGGSALLVGIAGSGRQSLTKLAAAICGESLYQPKITKNYGINNWHEDLRKVLKEAGGLGKDTVLLLSEGQIKSDIFLQDIDCLLNLGEVPNIFPIDERQEIFEMVRLAAQGGNRNADISPLQVFAFFVNRCKQKLHIILCFSPIGPTLRNRIRLYPSFVNCCTIDWFPAWPNEALERVAKQYVTEIELPISIKDAAVIACQHFHVTARDAINEFYDQTGRHIYITSASYLELIRAFQSLTNRRQKEITAAKQRYMSGLDTLQKAAVAVAEMQKDLNDLQPKLVALAENSKKMMEEINTETEAASIAAEQVKRDEIVANDQAKIAQALKDECEKDLAQAIPVLTEAINALKTLTPQDITLVKSMKNPPSAIKLVMAAVCVLKGVPPERITDPNTGKKTNDYWGPSKRILGDMGFLLSLMKFDKAHINPEIMKKIRKDFIPNKDFLPHKVVKASSAAEGLCRWVIAMDLYDNVAKNVAPKQAKLKKSEEDYAETMNVLNQKREMAEALEHKVRLLNAELEKANEEMKSTQRDEELCRNKLSRAETLIGSLGGEKTRWTLAAENLQIKFDHLAGDILISCGMIAYLAPFTSSYRTKCIGNWYSTCRDLDIPISEEYSFVNVLGSDVKIQSWNMDGLPRDLISAENAIIMNSTSRYSLFIDPQGQANKWIKQMERGNKLHVVKFTQKNYMKVIEGCIEMGHPVLIENILEDLEVSLDPILFKSTFLQGGVKYISLGDNIIPINSNFRFYMTSNLRNPHFLPETFNKATFINFSLTQQGLQDQLLGIVVAKERPDLQELRQSLIIEKANMTTMLKNTEDNILETLSSIEDDILMNEKAIQVLQNSQQLAVEIQEKRNASKETEMKIETFRQSYHPVATHSSVLYYSITDLPNVDPMYQFSLNWYINLYIYSIENANKSKMPARRLKFLMDAITYNLYTNVCRSLFEKDKLFFSFILTTKIMIASGQITESQLYFLLYDGGVGKCIQPFENPDPQWISDQLWENICKLEQLTELSGFIESFQHEVTIWKQFYDHSEPQNEPLPGDWEKKTSRFEKILILKIFRPDKVFLAVTKFVAAEMGERYVSPPLFDIEKSFKDSHCLAPLIFILSPGADPMRTLLLFAEKLGFDKTFHSISLGQGQGPIAEKMIQEAQVTGSWICLQNCHLSAWMPTLEYLWENMDSTNTSSSFRLWLTSYPSNVFPVTLLKNAVKMTNEPPTGLQQNLLRSYNSEPMNDDKFYTGCADKDRAFTRLLYGICFFHAVVQERKKFGPLGWNISYGFNESDLQISVLQLQMFLNQYETVPYDAMLYLTGECNYGGRVTDIWDRRAINTILSDFIDEKVVNDSRYKFANDETYALPRKSEHREIVRYIEKNIPNMPSPEVYGLNSNAAIIRDLQTSNMILDSMILTAGKSSEIPGAESEKNLLTAVDLICDRLPSDFDIELVQKKYPIDYNDSLNTVLLQEILRFSELMQTIRDTCIEMRKVMRGLTVMTPELEDVMLAINYKKIPSHWMKKSYPSLKPLGSYIQDFCDRVNWFKNWYENGKPSTFWISGFFFTQSFLTGVMQNYARKYKLPIDTLTFDFSIKNIKIDEDPPENGVYINGLFIEGARWDWSNSCLEEQKPKVTVEDMPLIHLRPILITELKENMRYKCPVYRTTERKGVLSTTGHSTNYVLPIFLETEKPARHWIKRSVALICQTND